MNNLQIKCQYCSNTATGINYRPRPELQNAPACETHRTSLFVPYASSSTTTPQADTATQINMREAKDNEFFQELMNVVVGEFNLLKSQVKHCQNSLKMLDPKQTYSFDIPCQITNPYMLLREDKEMMLNAFLARIKKKFDMKRSGAMSQNSSLKNSRYDSRTINQSSSPKMKFSMMTAVSKDSRSQSGTPNSKLTQPNFFRKQDPVKE